MARLAIRGERAEGRTTSPNIHADIVLDEQPHRQNRYGYGFAVEWNPSQDQPGDQGNDFDGGEDQDSTQGFAHGRYFR